VNQAEQGGIHLGKPAYRRLYVLSAATSAPFANQRQNRTSDMAGLKDKRGFIDKDRLDLSERQAVEYWMKRWGVTRDQLTAAHRKAGRMVKDIAAELGKKR
jgi:hypothetical protein